VEAKRRGAGVNGLRAVGLTVGLAVVLGACGSSEHPTITNVVAKPTQAGPGVKRFSAPGMAIHFDYPSNFRVIPLAPSKRVAGTNQQATHAAVGLGPYDLLVISRFPGLPIPVTSSNVTQLKPQFDNLIGQVFGRTMDGTVGSAGGLPAIFWQRVPTPGLPGVTNQPANVFVRSDEYEIQCQATQARLAQIEAACRQLFATLQASPS
jgi:hypothetical protein